MGFFRRYRNLRSAGIAGVAVAFVIFALCGAVTAQIFPFERNKVVDIDPHEAFVDGYRAWQRHDWPATIERMQLVAAKVPDLADYALFYLANAQRANGDAPAAGVTMKRLIADYPQSVFADQAQLTYAQIELDQHQPSLAVPAAAAVVDRTNDSGVEQGARLGSAGGLEDTGDLQGAYARGR